MFLAIFIPSNPTAGLPRTNVAASCLHILWTPNSRAWQTTRQDSPVKTWLHGIRILLKTMSATSHPWRHSLQSFGHPRVITMLFLGFSAGLPLLLIFSSLSLWLREAGVERSAVTFFSWAALGYSFKFVWAPLVDTLTPPSPDPEVGTATRVDAACTRCHHCVDCRHGSD